MGGFCGGRAAFRGGFLNLLTLVIFVQLFGAVGATTKHGEHQNHQQFHRGLKAPSLNITGLQNTSTNSGELIAQALAAMEIANKLRMENIHFNKKEFRNWSTPSNLSLAPPLLDYLGQTMGNEMSSNMSLKTRQSLNSTGSTNITKSDGMYSISEDLTKALRVAAEADPQQPSSNTGSPGMIELLKTFRHKAKDTNAMPQKLVNPNGLFEYVTPTIPNPSLENNNITTPEVNKRAAVSFWMETMQKNGASPFAPAGYQVSITYSTVLKNL
jgi:hypothetical protein